MLCGIVGAAKSLLGSRAMLGKWRRYRVGLENTPSSSAVLVPVTDELMTRLRQHADRDHLGTTYHFWDVGFRNALLWLEEDRPLCIQWLLTETENPLLRKLGEWSGMYPPLPPLTGQVEGLYAFTDARRKGVATDFEFALYERARSRGLEELVTHVTEENEPTHKWAKKTGWTVLGSITRLVLDLPGLRNTPLCVHCSSTSSE
jgi:GNAT superfamily N-acetyltransferase